MKNFMLRRHAETPKRSGRGSYVARRGMIFYVKVIKLAPSVIPLCKLIIPDK